MRRTPSFSDRRKEERERRQHDRPALREVKPEPKRPEWIPASGQVERFGGLVVYRSDDAMPGA